MGLLGPGESARTTLHLEPGTYTMVCLMPTFEDESHLRLGMIAPLVVTEAASGASPPQPAVRMRYDAGELTTDTAFRAGRQVVAFHVDDAIEDEEGGKVGAHLTRLDDGTDVAVIVPWVKEENFRNPAPTSFVGGADEISEVDTAYMTLDLEPGRYAWVAYPFTSDPELVLDEFTVE